MGVNKARAATYVTIVMSVGNGFFISQECQWTTGKKNQTVDKPGHSCTSKTFLKGRIQELCLISLLDSFTPMPKHDVG